MSNNTVHTVQLGIHQELPFTLILREPQDRVRFAYRSAIRKPPICCGPVTLRYLISIPDQYNNNYCFNEMEIES